MFNIIQSSKQFKNSYINIVQYLSTKSFACLPCLFYPKNKYSYYNKKTLRALEKLI